MKDIAEYAQVSLATVSRVLNESGYVSVEKRQRVMDWVGKLEYKPNASARDLAGSRSYLIGIILPDISNPFFAEIFCQMEEQAFFQGYSIIISNTKNRKDKIREIANIFKSRQVDGLLVCIDPRDISVMDSVINKGLPIVSFTQLSEKVDSISISIEKGGALIAQHFLDLGHENVAFIGEKEDPKFVGFQQILNQNGVYIQNTNIFSVDGWGDLSSDAVIHKVREFVFSLDPNVSAIFAFNDLTAIHTLRALQEKKVRVPEDVVLAGFDNIFMSREIDPPLTSIAQPTREIGRLAVEMLIRRINDRKKPIDEIILEPRLIVRKSTLKI
jgi:LacI family transcriptional regulator